MRDIRPFCDGKVLFEEKDCADDDSSGYDRRGEGEIHPSFPDAGKGRGSCSHHILPDDFSLVPGWAARIFRGKSPGFCDLSGVDRGGIRGISHIL